MTRSAAIPTGLVLSIVVSAIVWNSFVGLSWKPALPQMLALPASLFILAMIFSTIWRKNRTAEGAFYLGLWVLSSIFATWLTYLENTLGLPLQDRMLSKADILLGFDRHWWASVVLGRPWFSHLLSAAYWSHTWQVLLSVIVFARIGPKGRNAELLTSILLGLIATIVISAFVPALAPVDPHGQNTTSQIVQALREGSRGPYRYAGIITFPSFHTVLAILLTVAHRKRWPIFVPVLATNVFMIISTPYFGYHYLVDLFGGAVIAVVALHCAQWLLLGHQNWRAHPILERQPSCS